MPSPQTSNFKNRLLRLLPDTELSLFSSSLERIELPKDFLLAPAGGSIEHVYFLESGLASIVSVSAEGQKAEAGMLGRDGFAPTPPSVGSAKSLHEVLIQSPGWGHRLDIATFGHALAKSRPFADLLAKSVHVLATQVSYTALSNAVHQVDERLARWLLMAQDRVGGSELAITHEYIALMLAVRRPSVTTALHVLEGNGFIRSERGLIVIRNREAMKDYARDAYGRPEEEYRELLGEM